MSGSEPEGRDGPDLRLLPAAGSAWIGMWVATAADLAWLCLGLLTAVAVALVGRRRRSWAVGAVAVVLLGCMLAGFGRWWSRGHDPLNGLAEQRAVGTAELTLVGASQSTPRHGVRPAWWTSGARLELLDARGQQLRSSAAVRVSASGDVVASWSQLAPGTRVQVAARLDRAEPGDSVAALLRASRPPQVVRQPGGLDVAVERVRAGLRESVSGLADEPRALVPALVVGDTSAMPADLVDRFRVTGLTHLTAVSGANLTLLLVFLASVARWCQVRGWWLRGLLVAGLVGFVGLCHAEPSVIRAAAMGLVGLIALGAGGSGRQAVRALCLAVIVILFVDPTMARSAGFALSVLASGGIVAWSGAWADVLARRMPRALAEGLATPLAAQLATQPLVTLLSGQVSLAGLAANLLAGPLVGPATVLGFLAAATAVPVLPLAMAFASGAGWCAQGLCWIARLGELLPAAAVAWPATPLGVGLVLAGCAGLVLVMPRLLRSRWPGLAAVLLLILTLLRPPNPPGWPPPDWQVVFCDVGQGDATVLRAGPRSAALVDAGPDAAKLRHCLDQLGVESVSLQIITHFHADHVTGIGEAIARGAAVVLTTAANSPAGGRELVARAAAGVGLTVAGPGTVLQAGQVGVQVLAVRPTPELAGAADGVSAAENDGSLVMSVVVGGLRLLLAGDVEVDGQRNALATGADLSADVLLVPHHGSSHQLPEFLATTNASVAVFSAGADNDYGHPSVRTQRLVLQLGMHAMRTDVQGSIAISRADGQLLVTAQRPWVGAR